MARIVDFTMVFNDLSFCMIFLYINEKHENVDSTTFFLMIWDEKTFRIQRTVRFLDFTIGSL